MIIKYEGIEFISFTCIQYLISYFLFLLLLFDFHLHHNLNEHFNIIKNKTKNYHKLFENKVIKVQYFVHYHNQHQSHNHMYLYTGMKNQYLILNYIKKKQHLCGKKINNFLH
jgi:hypothetical protein